MFQYVHLVFEQWRIAGDRIVAINGKNLLNLRYEKALKLLQSSSETVELVLSQIEGKRNQGNRDQEPLENNYLK